MNQYNTEQINTACYERIQDFWISGLQNCPYADIRLPIGNLEFHIVGNHLESSVNDEQTELNRQTGFVVFYINQIPFYGGTAELSEGDILYTGYYSLAFFKDVIEISGDIHEAEISLFEVQGEELPFEGYPFYKKSPRIIYRTPEEKIEIKQPPQKREMSGSSLAQMIVPSVATAAFTVIMGVFMKTGPYIYMSIGMTVITVIFSVKNYFSERKETIKENKLRDEHYTNYLLGIREDIRKKRMDEREALDYMSPDANAIESGIRHFNNRLYERSIMDDDFLKVCLGFRVGNSKVAVTYGRDEIDPKEDALVKAAKAVAEDFKDINKQPVNVNLRKANLGIVGSRENVHEQLKLLMQQLTFFQSYHDLEIVLIHDESYREEFAYMRWYPHLRMHAINVIGEIYADNGKEILSSLQQVLKDRQQKTEEKKEEQVFKPHLLFIIDEPKLVLNHPIMEYLQKKTDRNGFSVIYTTDIRANLPENMGTVWMLENTEDGRLLLEEGERKNITFQLQHIHNLNLEWEARKLAAIIHEEGVTSRIPEGVTFFAMYGIKHPEELHSEQRWKKNQSHKSLAVPLGLRAEDDIVELNLHEKAHGPHGLVAGTTGSGKSEIIQSYILSLAVNFHPHEVGFLLIDYKGGGMANLFTKLPHLLGTITNLDKAESMRAMASIKSELARRQRIFSDNNVNHINGYNKLFKLGKVEEPLPHLFLISDEFAELKKEQPEFMSELISTARIGRSLGIHLILATQKPSGVVDDQIWTNSKFKLCLKVQDEGDSKEMLKTPDAANITQAGRAYLQVGNNEIYELFQSAWSGASYSEEEKEEEKEDDRVWILNELGQGQLLNKDLGGTVESNKIKETQLDVIVKYLHDIYEQEHAVEVKKPWLPSLPVQMLSPYTEVVQDSASFTVGDYTLGIGMADIPEAQTQTEVVIDFIKNGHLLYMASAGYGKSVFLANLLIGLAMKNAVRNLNFYILDIGNSALIPLKMLPHTADYMGMDDTEKVLKFRHIIEQEMADRKKKFAQAMAQNITVYNEMTEEKLKVILIAIDNYDAIREVDEDMEYFIQKVSRDGAGLGIFLVVTMTRSGAMRSSVMNNFKEKIAGYNYDDTENRALIGRSDISVPEDKKGRAVIKLEDVNLMQLYIPVSCDTELVYTENIKNLIKRISDASTEKRAVGIPVLPDELFYEQLQGYPEYKTEDISRVPIGIETENLNVQYMETRKNPGLIIGGSQTGRTNCIQNALQYLSGQEIYLFDNSSMALVEYQGKDNIHYAADVSGYNSLLDEIEQEVERRKEEYEEAKLDQLNLIPRQFSEQQPPIFVVIDIVQQLYDLLDGEDQAERLDMLAEAKDWGILLIVTAELRIQTFKGSLFNLLGNLKCGIVLGSIRDQDQFSTGGLREDNHDIRFAYNCFNGNVKKIMLPKNV